MRIILFAISALLLFGAFAILGEAKSAIHEIEAYLLMLISAVTFVGACVIHALAENGKNLKEIKGLMERGKVEEAEAEA